MKNLIIKTCLLFLPLGINSDSSELRIDNFKEGMNTFYDMGKSDLTSDIKYKRQLKSLIHELPFSSEYKEVKSDLILNLENSIKNSENRLKNYDNVLNNYFKIDSVLLSLKK